MLQVTKVSSKHPLTFENSKMKNFNIIIQRILYVKTT